MPELPEVETVRTSLLDRVIGRSVEGLRVGDFAGVVGPLGVEATRARIVGRRFVDVTRRGKYLFFRLDDGTTLLVHLRMTGQLQLVSREAPPLRFEHLALALDGEIDLRFADQRKFGRVLALTADEASAIDLALGPEPLEPTFTPEALAQRLAGRTARVKAVLLDQRFVAGLGNIYADEALFRAGIHPERTAGDLIPDEIGRLHAAIREVLTEAVANRGTTFSSFRDADGSAGENQHGLRVYGRGRAGLPCPCCGTPVAVIKVGGRSSHFCPTCQT